MATRRRYLTDDLLIGAGLVTFFVTLGIVLTAVTVVPTRSQRAPTLLFGTLLGFCMLAGALRVAQFRERAATRAGTEPDAVRPVEVDAERTA